MRTLRNEANSGPRRLLDESPQDEKKRLRKVAIATIVGTTVEWYDFYLYATMASIVFGTIFFPAGDSQVNTLSAFATFAVGFIARPIGGIVFGHLGDRLGRKKVLVITFALMGISTFCIGFLPTYANIGAWAPILLVILRVFQGMGAGAEYASAAVNSYEHAQEGRRGRQGAWPALGLNIGLVLSSATIFLLTLRGDEFLLSGGWRIPFIISILLVGIGMWIRSSLPESPEFEQKVENKVETEEKAPPKFFDVFIHHWRPLLVVFIIAIGYNALSYIFKTFSLAYLDEFQGVSANVTSGAVMVAGMVAIVTVPAFGELCDKFGSKTVIMAGGALSAVFAFMFLALLQESSTFMVYLAIAIGTGVLAPMMFSAQGSFLSRQFPPESRSAGVGTAREIGTAVAGGLAPLGALSLVVSSPSNSTTGVGWVLVIAGVLVAVGALFDQGRRYSTERN
ncbi:MULTISPECIES: MFS transporter [Brevibacterium]|uniref:MFS transporter n=2 Tax=Brevibacterium TaxID=1696 RepID=A0ABN2CJJ9_9MICO|nr:MFS transporter [Brevibacterium sandarakinum]SDS78690.1 Predicted arabinose efflux permease, MFS family [Brevibacterium sandarakinum]